tara:strand:+ start:19131 stop:19589 length:459 start_codon:yes stop_codon:yes gene_type:complete
MPTLQEYEKESKRRALQDAVNTLKKMPTFKKNLLTQSAVCNLANQSEEAKQWVKPISVQTLKSDNPKGLGYEARNQIIDFKKEYTLLKQSSNKQLVEKLEDKDEDNDKLLTQIVQLLDNEIKLKKEIHQLEVLLKRKDDEIISLRRRLEERY